MKIAQRIGGFPIELILSRWGGWGGGGEKEVPAVSFHEEPVRTSFGRSLNEEVEIFVILYQYFKWYHYQRFKSISTSKGFSLRWMEFRGNRLSQVIQPSTKLTSVTTHYHSKESVQNLESTRAVISVIKKERIMVLNPFSSISRILVSNFKLLPRNREVQWWRWKSHRKKYDRLPGVWHHESLEAIRLLHGKRVRWSDTHRNGETESADWSFSLLQSWFSSQSGSAKDSQPDFLVLV